MQFFFPATTPLLGILGGRSNNDFAFVWIKKMLLNAIKSWTRASSITNSYLR